MKQIETLHLFPQLTEALLMLLRSIDNPDWLKPSPIEGRTVKDLVSHLIDGSLRKLAIQRDGFTDTSNVPDIRSYDDLVQHIQALNRDWMNISRRLSPEILIDLLEYSENQFNVFLTRLDPNDNAIFPVNWAGESESKNWFDIAREYTEKWHHQMQIRLALDKPLLMEAKFTEPLYDTFMLGLPFLYNDFDDFEPGYRFKISLIGTLNKTWFLEKHPEKWILTEGGTEIIDTSVELADNIAWVIFTNTDREKEKYRSKIKTVGDDRFGSKLLEFVAVMS